MFRGTGCNDSSHCDRVIRFVWKSVRFVYHKLSSIKIDNKVVCPLESLDLSNYISGPVSSELIYDLQSCVCHFGGSWVVCLQMSIVCCVNMYTAHFSVSQSVKNK